MSAIPNTNQRNIQKEIEDISKYFHDLDSSEFPFQKSSSGCTGVTFLPCAPDFKWVIKWQKPSLCEAEHLSTEFFRRSFKHLSIPKTILFLPPSLNKKITSIFQRERISIAEGYLPLLIEYKDGNTLKKHFEFSHFNKLPFPARTKLFAAFGEVSGYDFLIANFDRFLKANFRQEIDLKHSVNGGNIIIELAPSPHSEQSMKASLSNIVHVIDTSPYAPTFFSSNEIKLETNSGDFEPNCRGIWDDEDPMEIDTSVAQNEPSSYLISGQSLREQRSAEFEQFMQSNVQEINILAEQIFIGIVNQIKEAVGNDRSILDLFEDSDQKIILQNALAGGLLSSRAHLKSLPMQAVLSELWEEIKPQTEAARITHEFIQKNLTFISTSLVQEENIFLSERAVGFMAPIQEALKKIQSYEMKALTELSSSVSLENKHRPLLESVRNDLYHFDDEKQIRIQYNITQYLKKHSLEDPELTEVLLRISSIISHFQKTNEVTISPEKSQQSSQARILDYEGSKQRGVCKKLFANEENPN